MLNSQSNRLSKTLDAIVVGGGPCGIAVATAFRAAGLRYLHLEGGALAQTVADFAPGVRLYSTHEQLQIGGISFWGGTDVTPTREDYLRYLSRVVRIHGLRVTTHTNALAIEPGSRAHVVTLRDSKGRRFKVAGRNVVVSSGGYYRPNLLGIPGETQPHVTHYFRGVERPPARRVLVVGGRNSAVEAAATLAHGGSRVLLAYRGARLPRGKIKPWLLPPFDALREQERIRVLYRTVPTAIDGSEVTLRQRGPGRNGRPEERTARADRVLLLTGYGPDYSLLRSAGVPLHKQTGRLLFNSRTLATRIPGIFMAGTLIRRWRGEKASIPSTRDHGDVLLKQLR